MENKVQELLSQLTLEEKASLCSGQDFWHLKGIQRKGIPSIMITDGPHGLRKQAEDIDVIGIGPSLPATCFPTAVTLASSWDRSLLYDIGVALGEECQQESVSVLLGPGINIKRSPLCGRNFEYLSEDPFIAGELSSSMIQGVQSQGIGTSLKHFAVNNQEGNRMTMDAIVDERALREIYLAGFEKAVKDAHPWTVMCSYNLVNGTYASDNPYLLRKILKEEWQHEGVVMSDWGATNDRVAGLKAGLELEMPGPNFDNDAAIVAAVKDGSLDEYILDDAVRRLLHLILKSTQNHKNNFTYNPADHHALAQRAAVESMVLLKNEDKVLPLKKEAIVGLIGEFAVQPRFQGAGSSFVKPLQLDTAFNGQANVRYAKGYDIKSDQPNPKLIAEAVALAKAVDVVIVMAGLTDSYESEGFDRKHMRMPESHNVLIEKVSEVNNQVIVVLCNGSPIEMPWLPKVKAVLEAYLSGEAGGSALWKILYGEANPSGKLAETFPIKIEDCAASSCYPMGPRSVEYRESIYVGYRYYDIAEKEVLFPFGYGLSYTEFEYSNLRLSANTINETDPLIATFSIKNIGTCSGMEIAQLYVRDTETTIFRPDKELKGFAKISLSPGEEKEVQLHLDKRAFAYYNVALKDWHVESGNFEIIIAASSRDHLLFADVEVVSATDIPISDISMQQSSPYYNPKKDWIPTKEAFEQLYGRLITVPPVSKKGSYHMNSTMEELRNSFLGNQFYRILMRMAEKMTKDVEEAQMGMIRNGIAEMPLRNLKMNSDGKMTQNTVEGLLLLLNGKLFKGLKKMLSKQS